MVLAHRLQPGVVVQPVEVVADPIERGWDELVAGAALVGPGGVVDWKPLFVVCE